MRAGAISLLKTPIGLGVWLALTACGRDRAPLTGAGSPPAEADVAVEPAPAPSVLPPAAATTTAEETPLPDRWDRFGGLTRAAGLWQPGAVDGLCVVRGPGVDVGGLDDRLRELSASLLKSPKVAEVLSRALDTEGRLVIRFQPDVTASAAQAQLDGLEALGFAAAKRNTTVTECALIARGQRAKVIWQLVAPGGPEQATATARALQEKLLRAIPCLTHTEVIGGVQESMTLEIQTRTLGDNQIGLDQVMSAVERLAELPPAQWVASWDSQSLPRRIRPTDGSPAEVPLSQLTARTGGLVATPRTARNGQVAVTSVVGYGGYSCQNAVLGRQLPELLGQAQSASQLHFQPVLTEGNVRLRLSLPRGTTYEGQAKLAQQLHEVRKRPTVIGLYAQSGVDGVPVGLDVDGAQGRSWAVWLTDSEGEGMATALHAATLLSASGWQVQVEPADSDTAPTWLLGRTGLAGVLLAHADGEQVRQALGKSKTLLSNSSAPQALQTGPTRLPGDILAAAWQTAAAPESVTAALLVTVDDLKRGPVTLASVAPTNRTGAGQPKAALGVTLRLVLPTGARSTAELAMPVVFAKPDDPALALKPILLGSLREDVLPPSLEERLRWNGRPTAWLVTSPFDRAPGAPEAELQQALTTLRVSVPDIDAWPWFDRQLADAGAATGTREPPSIPPSPGDTTASPTMAPSAGGLPRPGP